MTALAHTSASWADIPRAGRCAPHSVRSQPGRGRKPLVVIDVAGMTPALLRHMPNLAALGWQAELGTVLPAVTCTAQATLLTGLTPARHGIVGNGWYFRELGEIHLWRQHNRLGGGEKLWETARRVRPGHTAANIGWWYGIGASTDITVTLGPVHHADGRMSADGYVRPPGLQDRLTDAGDATVVALSEYGITDARRPIDVNRALRGAGLLEVYTQAGMEYLDTWTSRAFAVADHQIAHVYLADPADVPRTRAVLKDLPGVDVLYDREVQAKVGLGHELSGELIAVAEPDAWFTYYYWTDDCRAPDFARGVDIHRKPGYDPAELFVGPSNLLAAAKAGRNLARARLSLRYAMNNLVPLDLSCVRGTYGRLPDSTSDGPVLLCSDPVVPQTAERNSRIATTDIRDLLLELQGIPTKEPSR